MSRHQTDEFARAVHEVLTGLRRGELVSYGWVADEAGHPGAARAVGAYLRSAHDAPNWWRVVAADGALIAPAAREQAERLRAEGHAVDDGRVLRKPERPGRPRRRA